MEQLVSKEVVEREVDKWLCGVTENLENCIKEIPTVPAIPMERIKQLREEMENNCKGVILNGTIDRAMKLDDALELIDNMIKEYEG